MATACLICYDPVGHSVEDGDAVQEELTVFTLRCLFQVEKYWLDKYQQQDKASVGIRLCLSCQKGVEQARTLYRELVKLAEKFREKQKDAVDKIRLSSDSHSSIIASSRRRSRRHQVGNKENRTEVVRQAILEDDHANFQGPLLIEDWTSSDIPTPPDLNDVPVKREVELPDDESGELETAFTNISEEATEVKSEPEDSSQENKEDGNVDDEEEAMDESLESDGEDHEEEEWSGAEAMETDAAPPTKVSRKRKYPSPKKKRIRNRRGFIHSLDDPKNDETTRMFGLVRCPFCSLQGPNNTRIALHARNAHPSDYNKYRNTDEKRNGFTCCGKIFPSWLLLWEHLSEKHENKPLYLCELCPEEFCTAFALRSHAFKAHNHKEQTQRIRHSVNIGITCQICGDLLKGKRALDEHMKQHDAPSKPMDESLRCPHCGILKKWNERGLHVHMANVHGVKFKRKTYQKEWPCSEPNCEKIYTGRENLEAHVAKVHKKEFLFHCDLCGAGFYKWQRLKNHQQHNHSNTQIICELCGESFKSDERLYDHRHKVHNTGQKRKKNENPHKKPKDIPKPPPEICDLCGKSFVTRTTLQTHKAMAHNINVKFRCHVCAKPFHANATLKVHLYSKHKIGERPKAKEMKSQMEKLKFQCQLHRCKLRFTKQEYLDKHVKEAHGDSGTEMPFRCQFCGKGFCEKWKCEQHEMIHTNKETRPFKCDICGKGFANQVNLRYHELYTHKLERKIQYPAKLAKREIISGAV